MADTKIDPFDVGALERSVNDSAGRVSGIWLSFVVFSAYLAAAASMITHRQIFLEEPIKLPTINIDLPLTASAILLPVVFVIYHVFVLLQVVLLARTADAYNEAIEHHVTDEADRIRIRQRLANTLFAQLFAGSSRERGGVFGWLLHGMAWITLAIAPVGVLIIFEIKFLPYHNWAVTWTHRGLIAFDLLAVLILWASAVQPRQDIGWRSLIRYRMLTSVAFAIFVLSNLLITFPGEPGRLWTRMVFTPDPSSNVSAECQIPKAIEDRITPSFDRLVLLGEDFVDDEKFKKIAGVAKDNGQNLYDSERTVIFRGRDLRCARLAGADLRLADFSKANLSGAILRGAHLNGSRFVGAEIAGAVLDRAQLQETSFSPAAVDPAPPQKSLLGAELSPPDSQDATAKPLAPARLPDSSLQGAQMYRAFLDGVDFERADLKIAQLEEASLTGSNLRGAALIGAGLRDAKLDNAMLQGASLEDAWMAGASLVSAQMQGASLQNTGMVGANLASAVMHGAIFRQTRLEGTSFYRTQLQGALFQSASFEGALFVEAQLQGVQMLGGRTRTRLQGSPGALRDSIVSGSYLWRAGSMGCEFTHVESANFEPIIEVRYDNEKPISIAADDREISDFIARSLEQVPDKTNAAVKFSKSRLQTDLNSRLSPRATAASAPIEQAWRNCASESGARKWEDFQKLAANLLRHACYSSDVNLFASGVATKGNMGRLNMWFYELKEVPVGKMFAESLLKASDEECPSAKKLTESTRDQLQHVINPGE